MLNLESRVNVSEVLTFANNPNLQNALDNIKQRLNVEGEIVILPEPAKRKLIELADSSPSIPFDVYTEVVRANSSLVLHFVINLDCFVRLLSLPCLVGAENDAAQLL